MINADGTSCDKVRTEEAQTKSTQQKPHGKDALSAETHAFDTV